MTQFEMSAAIVLVAVGAFAIGRLWEMMRRHRKVLNERIHNVCAGAYYELDSQSPFDGAALVQVLCIKDGWVQYKFMDAPSLRPDSKTISDFCAIYKPAVG